MTTQQHTSQPDGRNTRNGDSPLYPSGRSRLPLPLLVEPVEVDAALARLMGTKPRNRPAAMVGQAARPEREADTSNWDWLDTSMAGVEVTEHPLPEGIDFAAFHALLRLAH